MEIYQIKRLRDYQKCPNLCKYDVSGTESVDQTVIRKVLEYCYSEIATSNTSLVWKDVRTKVTQLLCELEPHLTAKQIYSSSLVVLETVRNWYIANYRDKENSGLVNIRLTEELNGIQITGVVDAVLLTGKKVKLVEFTDLSLDQVYSDIGFRTKIWLLGKAGLKVTSALVIKCTNRTIETVTLKILETEKWNLKNEQILKLITISIKNKIFYPSVTSMCNTCQYKSICSW